MVKRMPTKKPKYISVSDLDRTLIGSRKALENFNRHMIKHLNDFQLVYITGRMYFSSRQIIIKENLIHPDILVIVQSMGHITDIPGAAGKGPALRYIQELHSIKRENTAVCGDSGNDLSMLFEGYRGIVGGNAQPELKDALKSGLPEVYLMRSHHASDITEGIKKYGIIQRFLTQPPRVRGTRKAAIVFRV